MPAIQLLLNPRDDEWVRLVGRYILNMGTIEATTRLLISIAEGNDRAAAMSADLPSRLGYLRGRFPRLPVDAHSQAMNVLSVALKHVAFRNIIAHSPLVITTEADGSQRIHGVFNLTPNEEKQAGELVGLEELRGRVNESAKVGEQLLQMQGAYGGAA